MLFLIDNDQSFQYSKPYQKRGAFHRVPAPSRITVQDSVEVKFFPVFFKEEGHIQPVLLQVPLKRCRLHMCVVCCVFGCGSAIACIFR